MLRVRTAMVAGLALTTVARAEAAVDSPANPKFVDWLIVAGGVAAVSVIALILQRERRLAHSMHQITSLLHHADGLLWQAKVEWVQGAWRWDFQLQPTSLSRRLFGEHPADSTTGLWQRFTIPEWDEMGDRCRHALTHGLPGYEQQFHFEKEGAVIWLHESVSIRPLGHQRFFLVGLVTDITRQREAEAARAASEERVKQLLARADCMVWEARVTATDSGEFDWAWFIPESELYRRITGRSTQPTRMPWERSIVPEYQELQMRSRRAMLQGLPGYEQEFRVVLNNSVRWMHEQVTVKAVTPGVWLLQGVIIDITAQRQAEESKRATEAQLQQIMDTADFLLWHARVFISPRGDVQWVLNVPSSRLYRRLFGREPEHPLALPWNELVAREVYEEMDRRSQEALRNGSGGYEQEFAARRGQQQFWLREQATIRYVAPGEWQVVGIVTDVTTRHQAEEARIASERALHEILERADCLLWRARVQRAGDAVHWSQFEVPHSRLRSLLLGDRPVEDMSQLWNEPEAPELAEMNARSSLAILSGASGYEQEFQVDRPNGSFWVHEQVTILPFGENEWRVVGVITDVTQRHQALEAQRQSDVRLQELLQRADCLIWQGHITFGPDSNPSWDVYVPRSRLYRRIYGRDPEGKGFQWEDIRVPEFEQMLATARAALLADTGGYEQSFHIPKPSGDIWLTEQVTFTRTGENEWDAVGVITDITARREAEEGRRATEAQLQQILELADCMVWQANVVEDETGTAQWSMFAPRSVLYQRLFGGHKDDRALDWRSLNVPEIEEMDARADRALHSGDPGYEQEFRVVHAERVVWLHEVVTITTVAPGHHRLVGVVTDITAQREAQEAYRASVAQLEQMLVNAECMLWQARVFATNDGGLRWVMFVPRSRLHRELFGRDPGNPAGIPWYEVVDAPTLVEMDARAWEAIVRSRPFYEQEFRAQRAGRSFWLHEQVSVTVVGPGEWKLVGVMTDMTARREAEQAVRASEIRYRTLYQHSPVAIVETDFVEVGKWLDELRGSGVEDLGALLDAEPKLLEHAARRLRFVDCNNTAVRVLRARSKSDFRRRRGALSTPDALQMIRSALLCVWEGRNTLEASVRMRDFEGNLHDLSVRWWMELTERGLDLRQSVMVLVDLTELKQAEAALAAEKERLAVTLRAMAEGVITTDVQGQVQYMNPAAAALTKCDAGSVIGLQVAEVCVLENDRTGETVEVPIPRVARGDVVLDLPARTRLMARDGSSRLVEGCCAPIHSAASTVIGTVLVFRDVTEHERLEQELVRATKLESVGVLAGGIAHDFNNILTAVMGNVALAALDVDPASDAGRCLQEAEKATLRARDLTQQLLTFAKGGEPVRTAVQLDGIVREMVTFTLHGSKVRAEYDFAENLWPADADRGQISRVVQNLVLNAVQAMPEGGTTRISLRNDVVDGVSRLALAPGDYVQIAITDTGVGIKPEHLPRIFDPYFTTKQKGSGLGLAAVYSIVNKHRGTIDVQSQLGVGTTFRIWLPATNVPEDRSNGTAPPQERITLAGRVLFMDDEEPIRQMASFLLRRFGFDVVCAIDGAEAVRKFRDADESGDPFTLVIMDLTVPGGIGGREAVIQLREIDPAVRAIVSSGYSSDPVLANYRAHGFCGVVAKPYEVAEFARVLREALASAPREG